MTQPTRIYKHSSAGSVMPAQLPVMVGGQESAKWFGRPELALYRVFAVNRCEESLWEI
jgi:hypothetical protein